MQPATSHRACAVAYFALCMHALYWPWLLHESRCEGCSCARGITTTAVPPLSSFTACPDRLWLQHDTLQTTKRTQLMAEPAEPSASASTSTVKSQYHHFIPRFILRNFVDPNAPPPAPPGSTSSPAAEDAAPATPRGKRGKTGKGGKKQRRPAKPKSTSSDRDGTLNIVHLKTMTLDHAPLSKTFGGVDLYRDDATPDLEQMAIEKALGVLESKAGRIIGKIRADFEAGKKSTAMPRADRDLLRKFAFIMMYRSKKFGGRFAGASAAAYVADDRASMLDYMAAHNITRPRDVWFAAIRGFINLEMDAEQKWFQRIFELDIYQPDALWFFKNIQMSYMALVTPADAADEFLLSENAYGVFEGPNQPTAWTDFHVFAPIAPRLLIVMRSNMLPSGIAEEDPARHALFTDNAALFPDPSTAVSCLHDMPIAIARNNYSRVVNGRSYMLPTRMGPDKHVFTFSFFPIGTAHTQKINTIFLEEAVRTETLVFRGRDALRRALEAYLRDPDFRNPTRVFPDGVLVGETKPLQSRAEYVAGVQRLLAAEFGSSVTAREKAVDAMVDVIRERLMQHLFMNAMGERMAAPEEMPQTDRVTEGTADVKVKGKGKAKDESAPSLPGLKGLWS
ncbi:hypothetical protein EDC01DRAFT_222222 [Geopyxis carbonaria]|nr:hypothetical protein EDC01DRAFT_222222 [Geopyxis carbonaria]